MSIRSGCVKAAVLSAILAVIVLGLITGCSSGALANPNSSGNAGGGAPTPTPTPSTTPNPGPNPTPSPAVPHSSHVVLVIEENHSFTQVLSSMPWLVGMGNTYAYATDYHADTPGSLLDYLWLSSGSGELNFGCTGNSCTSPVTDDNIFRELQKAGVSWKLYAESLPFTGYMGGNTGEYADRHNPAKWYSDVISSTALQLKMVPFTQFAVDLANNQLPQYSIIVPNLLDDAHDGTLQQADAWLSTNVAPMLAQPFFQTGGDGLLIVTFDECDAAIGACPEQVYTAVIGPNVKQHYQSAIFYKHENTLRTMLDALGVSVYPGAAATVSDMSDFFQ